MEISRKGEEGKIILNCPAAIYQVRGFGRIMTPHGPTSAFFWSFLTFKKQ